MASRVSHANSKGLTVRKYNSIKSIGMIYRYLSNIFNKYNSNKIIKSYIRFLITTLYFNDGDIKDPLIPIFTHSPYLDILVTETDKVICNNLWSEHSDLRRHIDKIINSDIDSNIYISQVLDKKSDYILYTVIIGKNKYSHYINTRYYNILRQRYMGKNADRESTILLTYLRYMTLNFYHKTTMFDIHYETCGEIELFGSPLYSPCQYYSMFYEDKYFGSSGIFNVAKSFIHIPTFARIFPPPITLIEDNICKLYNDGKISDDSTIIISTGYIHLQNSNVINVKIPNLGTLSFQCKSPSVVPIMLCPNL
jgi:hypothetical protein